MKKWYKEAKKWKIENSMKKVSQKNMQSTFTCKLKKLQSQMQKSTSKKSTSKVVEVRQLIVYVKSLL